MKLRLLAASVAALALASGAVIAQTATPAPTSAAGPSEKALLSYAIGYDVASDMAERKADLDIPTLIRGIQDGYAKRDPAMPRDKLAATWSAFQKRMAEQERAEFEKVARENKTRSDAFLAANKSKPGVLTLPGSTIQYKVIDVGTGPKPTSASTVTAHLRGSLTTGQEFYSTYSGNAQPISFKVSDYLIPGVREALVQMPVGSRWEIYIPAEKALGNDPRSPVGPGQAMVYDVRLISTK